MKKIIDLDKKAKAILINGRPFVEGTILDERMGFRWGRAAISISNCSPEDTWRTRFYSKGDTWDLDAGWDLEILRNLNLALDQKIKGQERRRQLTGAQKFYGNLILKELAN